MSTKGLDLTKIIKTFPDFPKSGILFRDINPVRGFVIATVLALATGKGLVLVRKAGKLPGQTLRQSYEIEYGNSTMEIQKDSIRKGQRVLIADDLVATGGTAIAAERLVTQLGGKVIGFAFVIELASVGGSSKIRQLGYEVHSLVAYE